MMEIIPRRRIVRPFSVFLNICFFILFSNFGNSGGVSQPLDEKYKSKWKLALSKEKL